MLNTTNSTEVAQEQTPTEIAILILSTISTGLICVSFLSHIIHICRVKSARDIAWGHIIVETVGLTAFLIAFGVLLMQLPVLIIGPIAIVQIIVVGILKCYYKNLRLKKEREEKKSGSESENKDEDEGDIEMQEIEKEEPDD